MHQNNLQFCAISRLLVEAITILQQIVWVDRMHPRNKKKEIEFPCFYVYLVSKVYFPYS